MRTKHIILVIVIVVLALAAALAWRSSLREAPIDDVGDAEVLLPAVIETVDPEPVFGDDEPPAFEASPEGLYDDLDAAFERAGEKPPLTLEPVAPPALTPPQRAPEDEEKTPDPA